VSVVKHQNNRQCSANGFMLGYMPSEWYSTPDFADYANLQLWWDHGPVPCLWTVSSSSDQCSWPFCGHWRPTFYRRSIVLWSHSPDHGSRSSVLQLGTSHIRVGWDQRLSAQFRMLNWLMERRREMMESFRSGKSRRWYRHFGCTDQYLRSMDWIMADMTDLPGGWECGLLAVEAIRTTLRQQPILPNHPIQPITALL
jgi:hypothetical protein